MQTKSFFASQEQVLKVTYSDKCQSELRRFDRRAAMCVEDIFFKTKRLQMKILLGKCHIALRKCQGKSQSINEGHLKQHGALDRLICHDGG